LTESKEKGEGRRIKKKREGKKVDSNEAVFQRREKKRKKGDRMDT